MNYRIDFKRQVFFLASVLYWLCVSDVSFAQQVRWLSVSDLQCPINSIGSNYENEFAYNQNTDFFTWPAQFGVGLNDQNTMRMEGVWIGVKDYNDPLAAKILTPKVVSSGPRQDANDRVAEIFPVSFQLIGKRPHPNVTVDNSDGSFESSYENSSTPVDAYDPTMAPDRMVIVKFNTSVGITVTRKVMVFSNSLDGNYFINDWVFKNTGIYDAAGDVKQQTLDTTWFYFVYRYAFAGEGNGAASETLGGSQSSSNWATFGSTWGASTLNHDFGDYGMGAQSFNNPSSTFYQMRGFYSYYGPDNGRGSVTYDEDWGCPAQTLDGRMCSAKFAGNVVLHADKSSTDVSDDISQPATSWFIASDLNPDLENANQYDPTANSDRWADMTEGHPPLPHDSTVQVVVGGSSPYEADFADSRRNLGGGTSQEQAFGPYVNLAPGDSVHIVFAQAVGGISREKNLEVGANWEQYFEGTGSPNLIMPDGSQAAKTLDGANAYKKAWVFTGRDSLIKAYREAINNYASGYKTPQPPQPPQNFTVTSEGDRINLQWSEEGEKDPHFNGYVIYRSEGTSMNPLASYQKVFECDKNTLPSEASAGVRSWDDTKAARGFDYYYYLQTKDDGTQTKDPITGTPVVLYSSLEWTITVLPASLQRPAIPSGNLPFSYTTMKWIAMKGPNPWSSSMKYGQNDTIGAADWVTFNGSNYVYVYRDSTLNAGTPGNTDTLWKQVAARGSWASGTEYSPYDYVFKPDSSKYYYTPYQISGGQGLDLVRVVPNPFDARARAYQFGTTAEEQDKIKFYGLPAPCTLKIFTERGDLIYTINHAKITGDETWYCQTSYGQIVASGIYILLVEKPDGEKVFRKFVIIR